MERNQKLVCISTLKRERERNVTIPTGACEQIAIVVVTCHDLFTWLLCLVIKGHGDLRVEKECAEEKLQKLGNCQNK